MESLAELVAALPEVAHDLRLNLEHVLTGPSQLSEPQRWGTALACAYAARSARLVATLLAETEQLEVAGLVADAQAAAALMAMNNVYYRFRHLIEKPVYETKPARLRMSRVSRPATNKLDFELFALAVSALNGCKSCVLHHEKVVLAGGLNESQVNDAMRIAATVYGTAVALELET